MVEPVYRPGTRRRVVIAWRVVYPGGRCFFGSERAAAEFVANHLPAQE
jgi:hypothetical protein